MQFPRRTVRSWVPFWRQDIHEGAVQCKGTLSPVRQQEGRADLGCRLSSGRHTYTLLGTLTGLESLLELHCTVAIFSPFLGFLGSAVPVYLFKYASPLPLLAVIAAALVP